LNINFINRGYSDTQITFDMTSIEPGEIALTVKHSPDNGNVVPDSVATDENDGTPVLVSNKNSFGLVESFLRDKAQVKWMAMNHQLREASMLFEHRGKKDSVGDEEHWSRYKVAHGVSYGSRSVGGKKPRDADVYNTIESIDYTIPDTAEEAHFARQMSQTDNACGGRCCRNKLTQRRFVLWVLYTLIGAVVSMVIGLILVICSSIEALRVDSTKAHLKAGEVGSAWLAWTGSSLILCLIAVGCVLIEPAAASSGIPGLIAYLNGVKPLGGKSPITGESTSFTSWETMLAKTVGMICSVPSGIAIGPEGPIIHISALLAHWTCIVFQRVEQAIFVKHRFTARASEARDFLATGAACGICTAFRAPLAGVMFVVEEASSFFTNSHLEYTFVASLIAYWVTWAFAAGYTGESTVKFKQTTGDFCSYHSFFDYLCFIFLGLIGGVFGAIFNQIVEHLSHFRVKHINKWASRRVLEVVIVVLITGSVSVLLPMAFACKKEVLKLMMEDSAGCLNQEDRFQMSYGKMSRPFLAELVENCSGTSLSNATRRLLAASSKPAGALGSYVPTVADIQGHLYKAKVSPDEIVWVDKESKYIQLHYSHMHICDYNSHEYNEMAMLWLNGGVKAVKVLLQRGFPHMLSWPVLLVFFCVYFLLAAITAGISVPAGLVVPMLLIGGSYGRLVGLGVLSAQKSMCEDYASLNADYAWTDVYYWSSYVRWMVKSCRMPDPGTYAIVGAASFLGGSGRITVMLATVLLELTDDASMIAPVGICCVIAMLVGNSFNHGLYHGLIPVFNIPFLNVEPSQESKLAQVKDVMASNVVCVPKLCHLSKIEELLEKCLMEGSQGLTHNGFPVVTSMEQMELCGLISREQLKMAVYMARANGDHVLNFVNLLKYCDRSPLTVYPNTRLSRAYSMFQKLGMRHLCVITNKGEICGIITRKNLMGFLLTDQTAKELIHIRRVQRQIRLFVKMKKKRKLAEDMLKEKSVT
jgi:chloride channel 7